MRDNSELDQIGSVLVYLTVKIITDGFVRERGPLSYGDPRRDRELSWQNWENSKDRCTY